MGNCKGCPDSNNITWGPIKPTLYKLSLEEFEQQLPLLRGATWTYVSSLNQMWIVKMEQKGIPNGTPLGQGPSRSASTIPPGTI